MSNVLATLVPLTFVIITGVYSYKIIYEDGFGKAYAPFAQGEIHLEYLRRMEKTIVGNVTFFTTGEGCVINSTFSWLSRNVWVLGDSLQMPVCDLLNMWNPLLDPVRNSIRGLPYDCPWEPNCMLPVGAPKDISQITISFPGIYDLQDNPPFQNMVLKSATASKGYFFIECGGVKTYSQYTQTMYDRSDELIRKRPRTKYYNKIN